MVDFEAAKVQLFLFHKQIIEEKKSKVLILWRFFWQKPSFYYFCGLKLTNPQYYAFTYYWNN